MQYRNRLGLVALLFGRRVKTHPRGMGISWAKVYVKGSGPGLTLRVTWSFPCVTCEVFSGISSELHLMARKGFSEAEKS